MKGCIHSHKNIKSILNILQALALLEFAITTRPDLLGAPQKNIESQTTDYGCSIFKMKRISNSIMIDSLETSKADRDQLILMESDAIPIINCPELFPLIIVCHAEKDRSITSAALQLLANNAHLSVSRWSAIFQSQQPSAIWTVRPTTLKKTLRLCIHTLCKVSSGYTL